MSLVAVSNEGENRLPVEDFDIRPLQIDQFPANMMDNRVGRQFIDLTGQNPTCRQVLHCQRPFLSADCHQKKG